MKNKEQEEKRRVVNGEGYEVANLHGQRRHHWEGNIETDLKEMEEWCMYISLEEHCRHKKQ